MEEIRNTLLRVQAATKSLQSHVDGLLDGDVTQQRLDEVADCFAALETTRHDLELAAKGEGFKTG